MLTFTKILLPISIDLEEPSLPAVHEAAALARHFHSELLILHVIRPLSYLGVQEIVHRSVMAEAIKQAEAKLDSSILPELGGIAAKRMVVEGEAGRLIPQIAEDEKAQLIVMGTHGFGALASALVGSVTAKVLEQTHCLVWTAAPVPVARTPDLAIRNVLCAVNFNDGDPAMVRTAAALADAFGARLTLAHVTPSVENYGPGGSYVVPEFKEAVVSSSTEQLTKLRDGASIQAGFFIGSGSVSKVLHQAAKETAADLLVIGRSAAVNRMGAHNFAIIRDAQIPVVSV
jgi:nucleotide-binding universal stress UspA family protein